MTDPTPGMVAMARRIAAEDAESRGAGILAGNFRLGNCDDTISVRCALAAIIETSEMAAKLASREAELARKYRPIGSAACLADHATALRAYDHIKPENG